MGDNSSIEWTDATWNPVRGCSIVSKGCTNCYAMRQAHRYAGKGGTYEGLTRLSRGGPVWTGDITLVRKLLEQPLSWQRPRRIFVNSMSDLFHEQVPETFLDDVFAVMAMAPQHVFQILTKRADRMLKYVGAGGRLVQVLDVVRRSELGYRHAGEKLPPQSWPLKNVWLGVSTEDQDSADLRIPALLKTPAAVRWISAEPLLGPIDFNHLSDAEWNLNALTGLRENPFGATVSRERGTRLDWVVAGGESGPGARPSHPDWFRDLRDQCGRAGVKFFFKQHGAWRSIKQSETELALRFPYGHNFPAQRDHRKQWRPVSVFRIGKKDAGRELDGRTHDEYPT